MIESSIRTARGQSRNWTELPDDFTAAVFSRLGAIETIESAQMVCTKWHRISKEPLNWLKIDMRNDGDVDEMEYLEKMCRHAIDRSCENVVDINIEYFGTDELLMFITNSASGTRCLRLFSCDKISDFGLGRLAWKLPFLEELDISLCVQIAHVSLEVVGRYCPLLKSLKLNKDWCTFPSTLNKRRHKFSSKLNKRRRKVLLKLNNEADESKSDLEEDEDYEDDWIHEKTPDPPKQHDNADAFAIARTMHGLHHLQLWGNKLTNDGLRKILDFCHHLESLDLRRCCNLNMEEDLGRRYAEQIKNLLHPHKSIEEKDFTPRSEECCPNWIELPDDIITSILSRFIAIDILETIQTVCTKWRKICKDPFMWHTIDLHTDRSNLAYDKICRHVIDRSCGNLVDVNVGNYITDGLLKYMTDSSSGIRRLRLVGSDVVSDLGVIEMASKLPLLEDLEIALCQSVTHRSLNVLGNSCPILKSLKFNKLWIHNPFSDPSDDSDDSDEPSDDRLGTLGKGFDNGDALAVGGTMRGLHHLQLFGNEMSNDGLMEILDGCPHLESLDLRHCYNLNLDENLRRRCGKQIKKLLLPDDSLVGYAHPTDAFSLYHNPKYISYGKYIEEDYSHYNDHCAILSELAFGDCEPTGDYMDYDCCSCFDSD